MAKYKLGIKIVVLAIATLIFLTSCNSEKGPLEWGMYESQVRYIKNISNDNKETTVGNWSWITCDNQEVFGLIGEIKYNFEGMRLTDIQFIVSSSTDTAEQKSNYAVLKENISAEYGEPSSAEIRESSLDGEECQYQFTEWNIEKTVIQLSHWIDNPKHLNITLSFYSSEVLKNSEVTETTNSKAIVSTKYKTKGEWALSTPYAFAIENDTYNGDIYSAGEYTFKTTNTTLGEAPMYDIYIEKSEYNSMSELGSIDYTVGGAGSFPISITLNKGDYVYIVPYSDLLYEPKGYLTFEVKD